MVIGAKVTLRGKRMDEFFEKLINVALPRIRGFDVSIITTAKTDEEAESLLELLGFPFEKKIVKKGSLS